MTFVVNSMKDGQQTTKIRSSAIVAVILARELRADGFEVSITGPDGRQYYPDQFILLLTSKDNLKGK